LPQLRLDKLVKNGSTYYGKARLKCKHCQRQFVYTRTYALLSNECKRRIELLLAERICLQAICRVMEIHPHQLYAYMDELYEEVPTDLCCQLPDRKRDIELTMVDSELDELWSFVGQKANKQWLWVALDRPTRQVVALFIGSRGAEGAFGLWQALPESYRQRATFHPDDWAAYKQIIPADQHRFSKQKKDTNHVERFFCTLRQRCSRLVRLRGAFQSCVEVALGLRRTCVIKSAFPLR
jgi:insertion element IS1 protein InsB